MSDVTDSLFRGEPSFLVGETVKTILGEDLNRVLGKAARFYDSPNSFFPVNDMRRLLKKKAPHRMATLESWLAEKKASAERHNAAVNRLIAAQAQMYMDEMGKDKSWAFWNAKFDVYRRLAPALDL